MLHELRELPLDALEPLLDFSGRKRRDGRGSRETGIMAPPVQADLLGFIDRTHEQAYLYREQLDVGQIDLDVTSNYQAFVEHAIEDVDKPVGPCGG